MNCDHVDSERLRDMLPDMLRKLHASSAAVIAKLDAGERIENLPGTTEFGVFSFHAGLLASWYLHGGVMAIMPPPPSARERMRAQRDLRRPDVQA